MSLMKPYNGTPARRVDGHAKVTGAAQYAAEFNAAGLVHGSDEVGKIAAIDRQNVGQPRQAILGHRDNGHARMRTGQAIR